MKLGNNIVESTNFNPRLQPQTIAAGGLMTLTFGYGTTDNNGNVVQQGISRPGVLTATQHYRYDGVNRLAIAAENAQPAAADGCPIGAVWCRDYTHDAFGNRAIIDDPGAPASQFSPTALSQFSALTNRIASVPGAANPAHDAVGNLVSHAGVGVSLLYDANNKMTSFTGTSPTLQQQGAYVYDGDGRRVQRLSTIAGTSITTTYVYDAFGNLAAEYSTQATETADTYYRTTDHLGSTRLVTRANGTVKKCLDFLPFGEPLDDSIANRNQSCYGDPNEGPFKQKFTTKERDDESGLDYLLARYYGSSLGRFTSVDPMNAGATPAAPQSWNGYSYVLDNPLLFVDPTGTRTAICGLGGNCSEVNEEQAAAVRKDTTNYIVASQSIYLRNEDGTQGQRVGSFTYQGPDGKLVASSQAVVEGLESRADASNKFIGTFAAVSVVAGASVATAPAVGQAVNEIALGPAAGRVFYHFTRLAAAAESGGRILDQSPAGRLWNYVSGPLPVAVQNFGWQVLSRFYASGAAGSVQVFPEYGRRGGLLYTVELPQLLSNPAVQSISYR